MEKLTGLTKLAWPFMSLNFEFISELEQEL